MHPRTLAPVVALSMFVACGPVRPGLDPPIDAGLDASEAAPGSGGVRVLSNLPTPTESDASRGASGGAVRDAGGTPSDGAEGDAAQSPTGDEPAPPIARCGDGIVQPGEECDDGLTNADSAPCLVTCRVNRCDDGKVCFCGDGEVRADVEECDDRNQNAFDGCSNVCKAAASHLLITEVVTRPGGAEMIEIMNPTGVAVVLSDYALSDSHLYYKVASGTFTTASGSDFAARFPDGATIGPGQYRVVSLANASGGSASFVAAYGKKPDFELRPTANGATDNASVPNMQSAQATSSIGASASLTDGGEPVILFYYDGGALLSDVDYLFYGSPSISNPVVDKTAVTVGDSTFLTDTAPAAQHQIAAPGESGSIQRCVYAETGEARGAGNGLMGHDETSEDPRITFALGNSASERTPGEGPPSSVCK
jgi:cysteine-rich repeat protein